MIELEPQPDRHAKLYKANEELVRGSHLTRTYIEIRMWVAPKGKCPKKINGRWVWVEGNTKSE